MRKVPLGSQRDHNAWSGRMNPFVRWPGHRVLMFDPVVRRTVRARALAACFAFAALVSAIGLVIAHLTTAHRLGGLALVGIALALSLLLGSVGHRLPEVATDAMITCGTILVSVGLGLLEHNAPFYAVLYVWLGGFAFYFLPRRRAVVQLALIAIGFALTLIVHPMQEGALGFFIILGSVAVCGALVMSLREALELSDHRFEHAFMAAPIGIALVGLDGRFLRANDAVGRLLGRSEAELVSLKVADVWHPGDEAAARDALRRGREDPATAVELEHRVVLPSGAVRWARTNGSAVLSAQGRTLYGLLQITDVTEQREAAEMMGRLAAIVESSDDAIVSTDVEGLIISLNEAAEDLYGYSREEVLGRPFSMLVPAERREEEQKVLLEVMADRRARSYETRRVGRDAHGIDVSVNVSVVYDASGQLAGTARVSRDISAQRRIEVALAESEERYRLIIETVAEGIWMLDANQERTAFVNPRMAEMLGYEPSEMIGRPLSDFVDEGGMEMLAARRRRRAQGELHQFQDEQRLVRKDGTVVHTLVSVRAMIDKSGNLTGLLGLVTDVTERFREEKIREQLERQLSQSQRLEGIGRLAGGIAHDFNNLLAVILNYAEFVAEGTEDRPEVREDAEEIRKAAERAAGLTHQLLVFSRREVSQPIVLHLDHVMHSMERMLRRMLGEDIALSVELEEDGPPVIADRGQIEQLLLNLVVNSREAMPGGGELNITFGGHTVSEGDGDTVPPGEYVRLLVSDTGAGIPPETVEHIFEPFFTTKGSQAGSGLGLATVYAVATQAGGYVDLTSEVGEGTKFRVLLPVAEEGEGEGEGVPTCESPAPRSTGGRETVLVVEDEPAVRSLTARILTAGGYQVLEADDGESALRIAEEQEGIELLLTDLVMPGMSGKELADELMRRRPGLRLLFMSGYTDDVVLRHGIFERRVAFLEKPFSSATLLEMTRDLLDDTDPGPGT